LLGRGMDLVFLRIDGGRDQVCGVGVMGSTYCIVLLDGNMNRLPLVRPQETVFVGTEDSGCGVRLTLSYSYICQA
jgi:hypothetical protein